MNHNIMNSIVTGDVTLEAQVDYITTCDILDTMGYFVHKALRVLICKECQYCVLPSDAPGHAHNQHGVSKKAYQLSEFLTTCESLHIHTDGDVSPPRPRGPPVQNLLVYDGFACATEHTECTFSTRTRESIEKHIRTNHHNRLNAKLRDCYRAGVKVQTLFPNFNRRFFEVEPSIARLTSKDPLTFIMKNFIPSVEKAPLVEIPNTDRERTPFMKGVNWDLHMDDYRTDAQRFALLRSFRATTNAEYYGGLFTAALDYVGMGAEIASSCLHSFTVRKHIMQGPFISDQG
jgi:hypothetical protein